MAGVSADICRALCCASAVVRSVWEQEHHKVMNSEHSEKELCVCGHKCGQVQHISIEIGITADVKNRLEHFLSDIVSLPIRYTWKRKKFSWGHTFLTDSTCDGVLTLRISENGSNCTAK